MRDSGGESPGTRVSRTLWEVCKVLGLQLFIASKEKLELGGVTQACNLHTRVTEAGQFRVQGQRGLHGETLSQRRGRGKWGRKQWQPTGLSSEKRSMFVVNTSTYLCCVCVEKRMRAHRMAQSRSWSWSLWQWVTWPSAFLKMKQVLPNLCSLLYHLMGGH